MSSSPEEVLLVSEEQLDLKKDVRDVGALVEAAGRGDLKTVETFLETAPQWVNDQGYRGCTPLVLAAWNGHLHLVKKLLDLGADIHARQEDHNTALMLAAVEGHMDIVRLLLAKGANANDASNIGVTALMLACYHRHADIAKLLLEHGANIDAEDDYHNSCYDYARTADVHALLDRVRTMRRRLNVPGHQACAERVRLARECRPLVTAPITRLRPPTANIKPYSPCQSWSCTKVTEVVCSPFRLSCDTDLGEPRQGGVARQACQRHRPQDHLPVRGQHDHR